MGYLYLAESAESTSHSQSGLRPSHTVSETDTLKLCSCREWLMTNSSEHQSGMTLHRLTLPCYQIESTSSTADSHAKIYPLPALAQAWRESEADFISKSKGLSAKQNQLSSSLKTSLQSGHADLDVWCGDFPSSGMTVAGQLYLPLRLAPRTCGKDGSYLPTPTACDYGKNNGRNTVNARDRHSLTTIARHNLWPTPVADDCVNRKKGKFNSRGEPKLSAAVKLWPTPRANDAEKRGNFDTTNPRNGLPAAIGGGQLNPTWVEWLMGYPSEWTALDALVTQWFHSKRAKRSSVSRESGVSA